MSIILPRPSQNGKGPSAPGDATRDTGGVLHLPDALALYPELRLVLYARVSSWGQAGKEKAKLVAQSYAVADEIRQRQAAEKMLRFVREVKEGKLSIPGRRLVEAAEYARKCGAMIVAADLSRFVRSESYCRRTNRDAWPTADEFTRLRELTRGVVLVTVADPLLSEDERHSLATRRTGKAGRPRSIDDDLAARIFAALGPLVLCRFGVRWLGARIEVVAAEVGVSKYAILRAADFIRLTSASHGHATAPRSAPSHEALVLCRFGVR
jgi:hypothetical protein